MLPSARISGHDSDRGMADMGKRLKDQVVNTSDGDFVKSQTHSEWTGYHLVKASHYDQPPSVSFTSCRDDTIRPRFRSKFLSLSPSSFMCLRVLTDTPENASPTGGMT
jgi:hypothetical protein